MCHLAVYYDPEESYDKEAFATRLGLTVEDICWRPDARFKGRSSWVLVRGGLAY